MSRVSLWAALVGGVAMLALPAAAQTPVPGSKATQIAPPGIGSEVVPDVAPGDEIAIACAPIEERGTNSDVRVVLTISAMPDEIPPGYKKVLATNEQLGKYGVRVTVPDLPDLPNHTVNLNVYVVDRDTSRSCDGGHLKVVQHHLPDFRHEAKSPHVS